MTLTRVLIAPSGFKESLDTGEVAAAIAVGVCRVLPDAVIDRMPLVDGGEGSAAALAATTGGSVVPVEVTGPVGDPVRAHVAVLGGAATGTAVIDMASAAGLSLVPVDRRDPTRTTTAGVGELLRAALDTGCRRVVVGCGDSGTSDGGAGALQALGARVLDAHGRELGRGAAALADVAEVDLSGLDPRLSEVELVVAGNTSNVLTGPHGVARVFGPQKGATPAQVELLAAGLDRWAAALSRACGRELAVVPGGGASGGLGAGLMAVGATLACRFDVFLDRALTGQGLDELIAAADLVITAEGQLDAQTPHGKVPAEVARRCRAAQTPVVALAGTLGEGWEAVYAMGLAAVSSIVPGPMSLQRAMDEAAALVADAAESLVRTVLVGMAVREAA
ncbi:glycerate kinase [Geodermatophilus sp. Leaf369]|uniref:glycerate kinase family protein n=1 Tax=Geodermatophilus sp. Leaf369 TaxID=1736354 RepID=UPI0009EB9FAB|nr:glycerate kinase [Geodermatophilus sp. Leaf369]